MGMLDIYLNPYVEGVPDQPLYMSPAQTEHARAVVRGVASVIESASSNNRNTAPVTLGEDIGKLFASSMNGIVEVLDSKSGALSFQLERMSSGIDSLNADFNLLLGDVLWKLELQQKSLQSIIKILQSPLDTQAKELRKRAEFAYRQGWFDEAIPDFQKSEELNYQDFTVHRSLGNIFLYHRQDLPAALQCFIKAGKYATPHDGKQAAEAYLFAGFVCEKSGQTDNALRWANKVTELNSELFEAHMLAARQCCKLGRVDEAITRFEKAIRGDHRYFEQIWSTPELVTISTVRQLLERFIDEAQQSMNGAAEDCEHAYAQYDAVKRKINRVSGQLILPCDLEFQPFVTEKLTRNEEISAASGNLWKKFACFVNAKDSFSRRASAIADYVTDRLGKAITEFEQQISDLEKRGSWDERKSQEEAEKEIGDADWKYRQGENKRFWTYVVTFLLCFPGLAAVIMGMVRGNFGDFAFGTGVLFFYGMTIFLPAMWIHSYRFIAKKNRAKLKREGIASQIREKISVRTRPIRESLHIYQEALKRLQENQPHEAQEPSQGRGYRPGKGYLRSMPPFSDQEVQPTGQGNACRNICANCGKKLKPGLTLCPTCESFGIY